MILSDMDIQREMDAGRIKINPYALVNLQPASVDVCLDRKVRVFDAAPHVTDPKKNEDHSHAIELLGDDPSFVVDPGQFLLGCTYETVGISSNMVARIEGKSSLGRLGLAIHATAGFVDPGFHGQLTLEISNIGSHPIRLYPGMKIAQVSFMYTFTPSMNPYGSREVGSKYQGQYGPTPSAYWKNYVEEE
jgi:dCTP deaminase